MTFDRVGSSHIFRNNKSAKKAIWDGHPEDIFWKGNASTSVTTVIPHKDHQLDYWNNHFCKEAFSQVVDYTLFMFSIEEINHKLKTGWGYDTFNNNLPRWVIREFFSMWLIDVWDNRYLIEYYKHIPSGSSIGSQDIILNFTRIFNTVCQRNRLTKIVTDDFINQNHTNFLLSQQFVNSQLNCNQWVLDTLSEKQNSYTPKTIYDEAYIQYLFRILGYEIKCDGLNDFPQTTSEMKQLIYANSHNHNSR
jgi:hypothetical protein